MVDGMKLNGGNW